MHGPADEPDKTGTATATTSTPAGFESTMSFLKLLFGHAEQPVYICSLANEKDDPTEPSERHVATRIPDHVESFIAKWDRAKRGLFICVSTLQSGARRNKESVSEICFLHADIDFKDVVETPDRIRKRLSTLPCPPSLIVSSGNGYHCYWCFKEPLIVNIIDGVETIERVEHALKLLADMVGGDRKPAHVAALMRLPGTHNSKRDEWKPVEIIEANDRRYELSGLEDDMLWLVSPIVLRKLRELPTEDERNPFLAAAVANGYKPPLDVEKRLAAMAYMGVNDTAIHDTQISVTASMLNAGQPIDDVVALVLGATRAAAGDYGKRWNWTREEREIRNCCESWIKKHPPAKPVTAPAMPATATVHKLADARVKKEQADVKPKPQKVVDRENMHAVIGQAALDVLASKGEPIMFVGDQLWNYAEGRWIKAEHGKHDLDAVIETCIRGMGNIISSLKLIAEVRGWMHRHPDVYRSAMRWDDHGKIAMAGGLIDIKTSEFEPAKPEHRVTARVLANYDPTATCPVWLEMLEATFADRDEVEQAGVIGMIQEVLGCALIEDKSKALSRALIFHGPSNTGKTDLIKVISGLLTDHPISTPIGALDGTHGLMEFHRKAPWVLHEAFKGGVWHFSDIVKSILSGDPVQINIKNGALITERIRQPIFWGTNYPPQFKEATRAIINRIVVIPTATLFDTENPIGVALKARAAGHAEPSDLILATERPGLLNWALAGLRRALERGRLELTADMKATLEAIRADGNLTVSFLEECIDFGPGRMISTPDFCAAFTAHYIENKGEDRTVPSNDSIGRALIALADPRIGIDRKLLRDNKRGYYAGMHLNGIGLDYWAAAIGDGLARGKTARTTADSNNVNRLIPPSWNHLTVVQRLEKHHEKLGATSQKQGSENVETENRSSTPRATSPRF